MHRARPRRDEFARSGRIALVVGEKRCGDVLEETRIDDRDVREWHWESLEFEDAVRCAALWAVAVQHRVRQTLLRTRPSEHRIQASDLMPMT